MRCADVFVDERIQIGRRCRDLRDDLLRVLEETQACLGQTHLLRTLRAFEQAVAGHALEGRDLL